MAQTVKRLPAIQETRVPSLGWEGPLEKEMATHSSTLPWKIPWPEEPGGLQSLGSQRVGHDWVSEQWNKTSSVVSLSDLPPPSGRLGHLGRGLGLWGFSKKEKHSVFEHWRVSKGEQCRYCCVTVTSKLSGLKNWKFPGDDLGVAWLGDPNLRFLILV